MRVPHPRGGPDRPTRVRGVARQRRGRKRRAPAWAAVPDAHQRRRRVNAEVAASRVAHRRVPHRLPDTDAGECRGQPSDGDAMNRCDLPIPSCPQRGRERSGRRSRQSRALIRVLGRNCMGLQPLRRQNRRRVCGDAGPNPPRSRDDGAPEADARRGGRCGSEARRDRDDRMRVPGRGPDADGRVAAAPRGGPRCGSRTRHPGDGRCRSPAPWSLRPVDTTAQRRTMNAEPAWASEPSGRGAEEHGQW